MSRQHSIGGQPAERSHRERGTVRTVTVAAALACRPKDDAEPFVACIADSRLYWKTPPQEEIPRVEDEFDKLFELSVRSCAVGAGSRDPFPPARFDAWHDIKRQDKVRRRTGARPLALWEIAGIFFGHLQREGLRQGEMDPLHALVAGFASDGSPALASATFFGNGAFLQMLHKPRPGEVVVQTIGGPSAQSLISEALAIDLASGLWRIDNTISLLKDIAADPVRRSSELVKVGGPPSVGRCRAAGKFEFPTYEIDGYYFQRGKKLAREEITDISQIEKLDYEPVFQELDTWNQVKRNFTGGQPLAALKYDPPLRRGDDGIYMGVPDIFKDEEPPWVTADHPQVRNVFPTGPGQYVVMENRPDSGLHPVEAERLDRYRPKPKEQKNRKRK